jgi:hypothetical protein
MATTTLFEKESIRSGFVASPNLHALGAQMLDMIFVLSTLNPPAARWSFDHAHTTLDVN